jgi:tRNA pseudouridine55 synthase
MDGVLVIDKPVGPTSHDAVARIRRALRQKRIGHTGTLDPAASGVLPLVIGRATRLARFLSAGDKTYEAIIRLGWSTDTGDAQGAPTGQVYAAELPGADAIDRALDAFRGTFLQQPPVYSAKKIGGRRGYALARANAAPSMLPAKVTAHSIDLMSTDADLLTVRVRCSSGFYVRSLAADLGANLGTGGHVIALRRTASGPYTEADAAALDGIERDPERARAAVIPLPRLLPELPSVVLTTQGSTRAANGREIRPADVAGGPAQPAHAPGSWIRLLDSTGRLLGVGRVSSDAGLLHPSVVLR